jgi:hypothetical protein
MSDAAILKRLARKGVRHDEVAERAIARPELVPELVAGLDAPNAPVKYGCQKVLLGISEEAPALLYPHFGRFVDLLDGENTIMVWGAIRIIANLCRVDAKRRFEAIVDRYFAPLAGPVMITAATIAGGAPTIAAAKPRLARRIVRELLAVERARYKTAECRNVALGHVIRALDQMFDQVRDRKAVLAFVERQLGNRRAATRAKAATFLRKRGGAGPRRATAHPRGRA